MLKFLRFQEKFAAICHVKLVRVQRNMTAWHVV